MHPSFFIADSDPCTCIVVNLKRVFLYVRIAEEVHITFQAALFTEPF